MDIATCERCKEPLTVYHLEAGHVYALALPESYTDQEGRDALDALAQATAHLTREQKPVLILMQHGAEVIAVPEVSTAHTEEGGYG